MVVVQPPLIDTQPAIMLGILQVAVAAKVSPVGLSAQALAGTPFIDVQPVALPSMMIVGP